MCREAMQEIKRSEIENIIIDCSYDILEKVLEQALQVGILSDKHRVIVTSLVRPRELKLNLRSSLILLGESKAENTFTMCATGSTGFGLGTLSVLRGQFHRGKTRRP